MRHAQIDSLRVLLAMMVVAIHTGVFTEVSPLLGYLLNNGLFRLAVPTFFVIGGYYLSTALTSTRSLLKWSSKLGLLYIFWMLVYTPFYYRQEAGLAFIARIALGYWHLWFIPASILGTGILFAAKKFLTPRGLLITALLLFLCGTAIQYYVNYAGTGRYPLSIYRNAIFFAFPLISIGHLLHTERNTLKFERFMPAILGISLVGLVIEAAASYTFHTKGAGGGSKIYLPGMDLYFSLLPSAPALFVIFLRSKFKTPSLHLAKFSALVYFSHPLLISGVKRLVEVPPNTLFALVLVACCALFPPTLWLSKRAKFVL